MKKSVRLACGSSSASKNHVTVPVSVNGKKVEFTNEELEKLLKVNQQAPVEEPIVEETPVVDEAPAEEEPIIEEIPVVDEAPAEEEPIIEEIPEVDESPAEEEPVIEEIPVVDEAPAEEEPVIEDIPVVDEVPAEEEPVVEEIPVVDEAPVEEEPVIEEIPAVDEAPAEEEPIIEEIPEVDEAPAEEEPVIEEIPVVDEAPAEEEPIIEEIPVADEVPAEEEPVIEEIPVVDEAPAEEEPIVEETPVVDEVPAEEEPIVEETPVVDEVQSEEEPVVEENPIAVEEPIAAPVVAEETPMVEKEPVVHPKKKQKRGLSLTTKRSLSGWLFVLPFVIGILFIYAPIVFDSVRFTFMDSTSLYSGSGLEFVGWENYNYIFNKDPWFSITIVDGLKDLILQIPAIVIFALFMAIILNQKMRGRTVFRAIFFLPVILCTGIIDTIDTNSAFMSQVENSQGGIDDNTGAESEGIMSALDIEMLLSNIKMGSELVDIVTTLINNIFDIVSRSGVQMLIFLSGLQSISPAIYESCQVEGATAWETFWKITLPMISPMILVNAVYTVIDLFTAADNRVMSYIFGSQIYGKSMFAEAGAMAWVYIGIVLVFIVLVAILLKSVVFYQRRD